MAGGKVIGYRKMAETGVNTIVDQLKKEEGVLYSSSETKHLPTAGGEVGGSKGFLSFKKEATKKGESLGIPRETVQKFIDTYGANAKILFEIYQASQDEAEHENIDAIVFAELVYGMEHDSVYKPANFFILRTGAYIFDFACVKLHK